jgi:hypothetical protein
MLGAHCGGVHRRATRRRHRPQRGKAAFEALQQKVMSGEFPAEMCHLAQPGTISDGGIDWLNVKVATSDVVRLCEEKGWRCGLLRESLTKPARDEAPDDAETECGAWLAGLPEHPRLTRTQALERFNQIQRKTKLKIIGVRPFLRAWKKYAPTSWHAHGRLPST